MGINYADPKNKDKYPYLYELACKKSAKAGLRGAFGCDDLKLSERIGRLMILKAKKHLSATEAQEVQNLGRKIRNMEMRRNG